MDKNEKRREKARALRYKKALLSDLNYDGITSELAEISEACDNMRYYIDDASFIEALDGDEEQELEYRMMFSELSAECEQLSDILFDRYAYDEKIGDIFDTFFVALMLNGGSAFQMVGYDGYMEDYYTLVGSYERSAAAETAAARLKRHTKDEIIDYAGRCFGIAMSFLNIKQKYEYLNAAFDIVKSDSMQYLQLIKDINAAYEAADNDDWHEYEQTVRSFERLAAALPDKAWIE